MSNEIAKELLEKYNAGNCTDEEKAIVESWFLTLKDEGTIPGQQKIQQINDEVWASLPMHQTKVNRLWPRIAAATSILFILSAGSYFILHKPAQKQTAENQPLDISPGHNQATLTLSNGQKIILTKGLNGKLAQQGNTTIAVKNSNAITYEAEEADASAAIGYNTLSTANGEVSPYPLILPDGTKVWLNAASSVTFPTVFDGKERMVKVTGEAYFEVVHNAAKPFKVNVKGQTIEDIGTQFNIKAYDDEPGIRTSLIDGSVKVSNSVSQVMLKPGQQAFAVTGNETRLVIAKANTRQVVAWKNGRFIFDQTDLHSLMREVARWYDLTVTYKGNVANEEFDGEIPRASNLSKMLKILASGDVHFQINNIAGKKELIITP